MGFLFLSGIVLTPLFCSGCIADVSTHPAYQRKGYGRLVILDALKYMTEELQLQLSILWTNASLAHVYSSCGYCAYQQSAILCSVPLAQCLAERDISCADEIEVFHSDSELHVCGVEKLYEEHSLRTHARGAVERGFSYLSKSLRWCYESDLFLILAGKAYVRAGFTNTPQGFWR